MDFIPRIVWGPDQTVIAFEFPPDGDPFGENPKAVNTTTTAANGAQQNNQQYVERHYKIQVNFVSADVKNAFDAFWLAWASHKRLFSYYPHTDVDTGVLQASLVDDEMKYGRPLPAGGGEFLYSFPFELRVV